MSAAGPRTHPRAVYLRLKAATRRLVETAGGLMLAAEVTRVGKTKLSDYGNQNLDEIFAAADVIADLEAAAGAPLVTRELARIAGHALIALPGASGDEGWIARLGGVSKETGAVIGRLAEALGDDGMVSAAEIRRGDLIGLASEAIEQLVLLRAAAIEMLRQDDERRGR